MVTFSLRMSEEVNNELQFLATMFDKSKTAVLESLIRQEYHKYQEDPKIKRAIEQMQELKTVFEKFKDENR